MIVSTINSIRFRKVDSNYPNIENTLTKNQKGLNKTIIQYCQRFLTTDTVKIQIRSTVVTLPTVTAYKCDGTSIEIIPPVATPVNAVFTSGAGTLAAGTYYYRVSAINSIGQTLASTETSFDALIDTGINVNWGAVTGATGYKIYGRSTGAELLIATVGAVTTYLDDGSLTPAGAMPTSNTTSTFVSRYDTNGDGNYDLWFFEFDVLMSSYLISTYIKVVQGAETWISEQFKGDADLLAELNNIQAVEIKFHNTDNAFLMDYSTGITGLLYLGGFIPDFDIGGEFSVYDNQNEKTILKSTAFKICKFITEPVPIWIYELLALASRLDNCTVNGISYTGADAPEKAQLGKSNLHQLILDLTDKEYLGVNTHDTGFDIETIIESEGMRNLQQLAQSGNIQFAVPAGWQVHTLTALLTAGSDGVVKAGTTIGGEDVVYPFNITSLTQPETVGTHFDKSMSSASTLYVNISGAGVTANIYVMLLKNIQ